MGVAKRAGAPRSAIRLDAQAAGVIAAGETGRRGAPRAPPRMQGGLVASPPLSPLPPTSGSPESGRSPADPAARHDGGSRNGKSRAWPGAWLCLAGPRPCTRTSRQRRVLAQDAVAAKSGGIVAIPRRPERLERTGVLILLDAINRQRDIAEKMRAKGRRSARPEGQSADTPRTAACSASASRAAHSAQNRRRGDHGDLDRDDHSSTARRYDHVAAGGRRDHLLPRRPRHCSSENRRCGVLNGVFQHDRMAPENRRLRQREVIIRPTAPQPYQGQTKPRSSPEESPSVGTTTTSPPQSSPMTGAIRAIAFPPIRRLAQHVPHSIAR